MDEFYNLIDEIGIDNPYFAEIYDLAVCEEGSFAEQLMWEYGNNEDDEDETYHFGSTRSN